MKRAIFAGSFDPFTIGHADIVRRALPLFEEVVIAIGVNHQKTPFFPLEERLESIRRAFEGETKVRVMHYDCLTVELCEQLDCQWMIRGVRTVQDFEYERQIADANKQLSGGKVETLLLYTRPELAHISSSLLRDLRSHQKDISAYLP